MLHSFVTELEEVLWAGSALTFSGPAQCCNEKKKQMTMYDVVVRLVLRTWVATEARFLRVVTW